MILKNYFNSTSWAFFFAFSSVYNLQNPYARLTIILLMGLFLLFNIINIRTEKLYLYVIFFSIVYIFYMCLAILMHDDTFEFKLDGANVEFLTPFLFIFFPLYLITSSKIINNINNIDKIIVKSLNIIIIILFIDLVFRYFSEPNCFLNYGCRFNAKIVGLFSTTNALGLSIATILAALHIRAGFYLYKFLLFCILITTMARAAIVSYFLFLIFRLIFKNLLFSLASIPFLLFFIYYLFYGPLNFINDESALSKLDFFIATYNLLSNGTISQILFGYGSSLDAITNILGVNGWSPHIPFLKSFLYYGGIGVFFYLFSIISMASFSKLQIWPISIYLIAGLAGGPIFFPTLMFTHFILRKSTCDFR